MPLASVLSRRPRSRTALPSTTLGALLALSLSFTGAIAYGAAQPEPDAEAPSKDSGASAKTSDAKGSDAFSGEWYGWQLFVVDATGIATGLVVSDLAEFSPGTRPSTLGLVSGVWYGVGGVGAPAVHWAHRETGQGFASLGLRTLVPPVVGSIGALGRCLGDSFDSGCASSGFAGGVVVGLAGTAIVDATVLGYERRPEPAKREEWYGWQMLSVDGAALASGLVVATSVRDPDGNLPHPALALWAPAYLFGLIGGPVVHFVHGNVGRGFASFGLRALVGPLGVLPGLMGYCAATGGESGCARAGALWGLTSGLAVVSAVDAFLLAYDTDTDDSAGVRANVLVGPGSLTVAGYW